MTFDLKIQPQTSVCPGDINQTISYHIVHKNPYRIRIYIPRLGIDEFYGRKLRYIIESETGISQVRINTAAKSIAVEYDFSLDTTKTTQLEQKLLAAIHLAPHIDIDSSVLTTELSTVANDNHEINYWERLGMSTLALLLSVGAFIGIPFSEILLGGIIFIAAIPVFQRAWLAIHQERELTIDFLDGLAISLHLWQGSSFAPAFMVSLIEGSEVIRDLTARRTERASLDLLDCLGKFALVNRDGQETQIPVKDIVVGDRVIVYPGDQIPVDGRIINGRGLIDQCKLTGESIPVTRSAGDEVFASTLLVDGYLCILTEMTGQNTRAGLIVNLMQSAPVHDTRVENYAGIIANQMVIPTLFIGVGVGLVSGDMNRMIALLTLDLGTGIRVSVPTTILSALTNAARNGVFIRSGRAIEILAKIDTVIFDKTGTLTQGHAGVTGIKITNAEISTSELIALAATSEQGLNHPIAEAIIRHAKEHQIPLYHCDDWQYQVGLGVASMIKGMKILVGSHLLMEQENISLDYLHQQYPEIKSGINSIIYVAGDGKLLGVILYSDPPREESKQVIQELSHQGISSYMLSGDMIPVAQAVAKELGIESNHVYAEAFPERKVEVVKDIHSSGRTVAFCGDGINDSAALAYADVSISFAGATDIARETADVVLMTNDLRGLLTAIRISQQAMEIIQENISIVAVPNIGALITGIFYTLDPILAIIINNGSAIVAELNGLRPLSNPINSLTPDSQIPVSVPKELQSG